MEGEQVQQLGLGGSGAHLETAHTGQGGIVRQRLDRAQVGDFLEKVDEVVRLGWIAQGPNAQFDGALTRGRNSGGGGSRCGLNHDGSRGRHRLGRHHRGGSGGHRRFTGRHGADVDQQLGGVHHSTAGALMAPQHGLESVARLKQHVHHRSGRCQLMAAQLVEQRFHLMGQLGHIGKSKCRCAPLDGVGAAEDGVEFLVIGGIDVQLKEELFHVLEVLARLFEEDLVELAEVNPCRRRAVVGARVCHVWLQMFVVMLAGTCAGPSADPWAQRITF